jgi:4-diphosphocytidyl-2C-methyl-D-erythritol kinase
MRAYSLVAPAKINLYLEIIGSRADGYHELAMVMQSVNLADRLDLYANGTDAIRVHCDHPLVPSDQSNLAYRAAELMAKQFPDCFDKYGGVDITVDKQIPVGAGLAGGSTNAAAVLVGLDLMWELGLTQSELQEIGAKLGSDVPFCIAGGTAIATGRGEKISPLPDLDHLVAVLGQTPQPVSLDSLGLSNLSAAVWPHLRQLDPSGAPSSIWRNGHGNRPQRQSGDRPAPQQRSRKSRFACLSASCPPTRTDAAA